MNENQNEREEELLYKFARLVRNTENIHIFAWSQSAFELLRELQELNPQKYQDLVKCEHDVSDSGKCLHCRKTVKRDYGIHLVKCSTGAEVYIRGFGVTNMEDGYGAPVVIDVWEGKTRVLVWGDINDESPTHTIDLKDAKETNRRKP